MKHTIYDCIIDQRAHPRTATKPRAFNITDSKLMMPDRVEHRTPEEIDAHLAASGIGRGFAGPITVDREDDEILRRLYSPVASVRSDAIDSIKTSVDLVRLVRPCAQVGVYRTPPTPQNKNWLDAQEVLAYLREQRSVVELNRAVDFYVPVFYLTGQPMEAWKLTVQTVHTLIDLRANRPALPMFMGTYHNQLGPVEHRGKAIPSDILIECSTFLLNTFGRYQYWGLLRDDGRDEHNADVLAGLETVRRAA